MGAPALSVLLLTFAISVGAPIWTYKGWSGWSGGTTPPWDETFEDPALDAALLRQIRSYLQVLISKPLADRQKFASIGKDNHSGGRKAVSKWLTDLWKKGGMNDKIDAVLQRHERLPHQLSGRDTVKVNSPSFYCLCLNFVCSSHCWKMLTSAAAPLSTSYLNSSLVKKLSLIPTLPICE